jgi:hypothetical protein
VTPAIDLDLPDEAGVGSPDASAGVPRDNFSVNEFHDIVVRYSHASGAPRLRVTCSGQGFQDRPLEPGAHPDGI